MTTRLRKPIILFGTIILAIQALFMPIGMVYAETTMVDTEEQEQVELPPMKNYLEEKASDPRFFFTRSRMQGTVEERLKVAFFSDQEVSEARVFLPEEATLLKDQLQIGISVEEGVQPNEWIIQSERAQNTFVLPLVVEKAGNYELSVEETTAHLEISEQEEHNEEVSAKETESSDEDLPEEEIGDDHSMAVKPKVEKPKDSESGETTTKNHEENNTKTSFVGNIAEVSTFEELRLAIANSDVGTIEVRNNLTRSGTGVATAIGSVNRSLLINGNGFTINFGADNGSLGLTSLAEDAQETIRVENATITKTGATPIFNAVGTGAGWSLEIENITEGSANAARLALIPEGNVIFTGGVNSFVRTNVTNVFLQAKHVETRGGAQVTISRGNTQVFFSAAAIDEPSITIREGSVVSITTTSGTAAITDLRGTNPSLVVTENSSFNVRSSGPTSQATLTANNVIQFTNSTGQGNIQVTENSSLDITVTTGWKQGLATAGLNTVIKESTLKVTTTAGRGLDSSADDVNIEFDHANIDWNTASNGGIVVTGNRAKLDVINSKFNMGASTDRNIALFGDDNSIVVREGSEVNLNGVVLIQGMYPEISIQSNGKVSVNTVGTNTAPTDTSNNSISLLGIAPKITVIEGSELTVVGTLARRGLHVSGDSAEVKVIDSEMTVRSATQASVNIGGANPTFSVQDSAIKLNSTTGVALVLNGSSPTVDYKDSTVELSSTTGQRMNLIGATPTLSLTKTHLIMSATSGRGIYLQGTTPQVLGDNSQIELTDTGASQGMILQGTDALLSLSNQSEMTITGAGTGTTENIQIGNNNARPELSVTGGSKLSVTTTSGTGAATDTTNNAIHLRGSEPRATVSEKSRIAVIVESGARRALNLNGTGADLSVSDSKLTTETLTGQGLSINGNDTGLTLTNTSEIVMNSTTGNSISMTGNNASLTLEKASQLHTTTGAADSIRLIGNAPTLKIVDEGTVLEATNHYTSNTNSTATILVGSGNSETRIENYLVEVGDNAKLIVQANMSSGLIMQGNSGRFNVYNQADVRLLSGSYNSVDTAGNANASLRFVRSGTAANAGGNTFTLDNARMAIEKGGGNAAAVRMFGSNNHIHVLNKGEFIVKNPGSGSGLDGGSGGRNQGIHYTGTTSNNNSFTVRDPGSRVDIQADSGPAIDMAGTGVIDATNAAFFQASGRTSTAAGGIFNAGVLTVTFDDPLFMDFRNNRPGGGNLFNVSAGSTMTATNSDLAVWRNGVDLDGDPDLNFRSIGYSFSGMNFNTLTSMTDPDQLNTGVFGTSGLTSYSRMSSNNGRWAIADELRVPTNADKKIHGRVSLPVGLNDSRPAWDEEAIVTVEVESPSGEEITYYTEKTVGDTNESPGISIYGEEPRGGLFEIDLDEPLEAGSKVRISKVELTSGALTEGFEHQILTDTVEVFPIIPPTPAQFSSSIIAQNSKTIQGMTDNLEAEVTATHNGESLNTDTVTVDTDGKFTLDLSDVTLEMDDEIQVFLRDDEGSAQKAGVINPPETNNDHGNINPAKELVFHDVTFEAATTLIVGDTGPITPVDPLDPEKEVAPENPPQLPEDQGLFSIDFVSQFDFGHQAISAQDQTYYAKPQRLLADDGTVLEEEFRPNYVQISDRRPTQERDGWELSVRQNDQFTDRATGQELRGARLVLQNQQIATAQGGTAPGLAHTNPMTLNPGGAKRTLLKAQGPEGEGTWIYRFGDAESADKSVVLEVPRGATPSATTYTTTLTWELSSVPNN